MGQAERLLCTCLQGVYQSNQATATGCQLNNIALMRGMIGKPGAGVLQMNGQPTVSRFSPSYCRDNRCILIAYRDGQTRHKTIERQDAMANTQL